VLDLLPESALEQARQLLALVSPTGVRDLWHAAAGDGAPLPRERIESAVAAFDHLITVNAGLDNLPPAVAFVEHVARHVERTPPAQPAETELAAELRRWNDRQARRLDLTASLHTLRARIAAESPVAPTAPCLVVQIVATGKDDDRFRVSHWLQHRPGRWQPERGEDVEVSYAELEATVEYLADRAEAVWADQAREPTLEFVLPVDLLNHAVDWWCRAAGGPQAIPFGLDYPLVLRSLERMQAPRWHRTWRNRWAAALGGESPQTHWEPETYDEDEIYRWNVTLRTDPRWAAVALATPPVPSVHSGRLPLEMALSAGVPVVVWDRRERPATEFRGTVSSLLKGPVTELSRRVQALRVGAARSVSADTHLGRHLAVLCDDPTRLVHFPPDRGGHTGPAGPGVPAASEVSPVRKLVPDQVGAADDRLQAAGR
jgi:hypothetical protein